MCRGISFAMFNLLYFGEKFAVCAAGVSLVTCLVITLTMMLMLGIGLGYNYCYVDYQTNARFQYVPPSFKPEESGTNSSQIDFENLLNSILKPGASGTNSSQSDAGNLLNSGESGTNSSQIDAGNLVNSLLKPGESGTNFNKTDLNNITNENLNMKSDNENYENKNESDKQSNDTLRIILVEKLQRQKYPKLVYKKDKTHINSLKHSRENLKNYLFWAVPSSTTEDTLDDSTPEIQYRNTLPETRLKRKNTVNSTDITEANDKIVSINGLDLITLLSQLRAENRNYSLQIITS